MSRVHVSYSVAPTAEVIDMHFFFFIYLSFYGNNTETQLELIQSCPHYPCPMVEVSVLQDPGRFTSVMASFGPWLLANSPPISPQ